jgi:hypothetical protein
MLRPEFRGDRGNDRPHLREGIGTTTAQACVFANHAFVLHVDAMDLAVGQAALHPLDRAPKSRKTSHDFAGPRRQMRPVRAASNSTIKMIPSTPLG